MAAEVTMPKMGYDMTEGTVLKWLKAEGDAVAKGDILAEIETGKVNIEMESFDEGILQDRRRGRHRPRRRADRDHRRRGRDRSPYSTPARRPPAPGANAPAPEPTPAATAPVAPTPAAPAPALAPARPPSSPWVARDRRALARPCLGAAPRVPNGAPAGDGGRLRASSPAASPPTATSTSPPSPAAARWGASLATTLAASVTTAAPAAAPARTSPRRPRPASEPLLAICARIAQRLSQSRAGRPAHLRDDGRRGWTRRSRCACRSTRRWRRAAARCP
ncbi:MAG: lipoyl domain-containing protein [Anaerolineae bacterium]